MFKIYHEEIIHNPSYYFIGQFSKYIRPGAKQILSTGDHDIYYVVFENKDGSLVVVMMNEQEEPYEIHIKGLKEDIKVNILPHSIQTLLI